jgi:hypothetical protein
MFRTAYQIYLIPGTEVTIDKIMICFYRKSSDICKILNKSIKQGYKIIVLVDNNYVWYFKLSLR